MRLLYFTITSVFFCTLITLSGCFPAKGIRPLSELKVNNEQEAYHAKSGDTLNVEVWGEPRLSGDVFVRQDGKFTMALINEVSAEDKTLSEISKDITEALKEFIPAASVTLSVVTTAPIRYYLSGTFAKPGEFRSDSRVTLLQAIATGGGFAPFADESNILLIRKMPTGEIRYQLNYSNVIEGSEPNPELKNGDIIAVK